MVNIFYCIIVVTLNLCMLHVCGCRAKMTCI